MCEKLDVFEKFKDEDGEFMEDIANDVIGVLSLYEACFLAYHGEDILDEALVFARKQLVILAENSSPRLLKHIRNSLMYPSHRTMEKLDTLHYISFYEEDESVDKTLLKFAKLDYNALQLLYRQELALLSTWWDDLNVAKNIPYARDRLVEPYVLAFGSVFEPQYSIAWMTLCKFVNFVALLDDTYDSYGTIDELRLLTDAVDWFTIDAIDELPERMKFLYKIMLEFGKNNGAQQSSSKTTFVIEKIKELATCYLLETTWQKERKAPSFDEYLKIGRVTGGLGSCASAFLLEVENMGMKEIQWMKNDPEICDAASLYLRLMNDIGGVLTDETKREDFPKAVDCYMIQHGVSQDEAIEALQQILENKWKEMNKDLMKANDIPRILLKFTLNYARMSILYYNGTDLYTYGHNLKEYVESFFINPLPM
ncbi:Terpene synthase 5 [Euphorbia peplus]|nr:Terpene synthase 5 [Euphorbia peplus]